MCGKICLIDTNNRAELVKFSWNQSNYIKHYLIFSDVVFLEQKTEQHRSLKFYKNVLQSRAISQKIERL